MPTFFRPAILCAFLLAWACAPLARADAVPVAVAANFLLPMQQIAIAFEKETGHRVQAAFGSTGKFYAQIRNGAPFELLLAADEATPQRLVSEGAALADTLRVYAVGRLVLWSAQPGLVDSAGAVLQQGRFRHLALADPKLAPYGAAGLETMKALGVHGALQDRLVVGESIAQAYQFVASGNAELGFVALSQVLGNGKADGAYWLVPQRLYSPIRQSAVVLAPGRGHAACLALLNYLQSDPARAIIASYGYSLP